MRAAQADARVRLGRRALKRATGPPPIRLNPLRSCRRRLGQRQLEQRDPLSLRTLPTHGNDLVRLGARPTTCRGSSAGWDSTI